MKSRVYTIDCMQQLPGGGRRPMPEQNEFYKGFDRVFDPPPEVVAIVYMADNGETDFFALDNHPHALAEFDRFVKEQIAEPRKVTIYTALASKQ
jgi:hypothetical protein